MVLFGCFLQLPASRLPTRFFSLRGSELRIDCGSCFRVLDPGVQKLGCLWPKLEISTGWLRNRRRAPAVKGTTATLEG